MIGPFFSRVDARPTASHPLRNLEFYDNTSFQIAVERVLADPAAVLSVPSDDLLRLIPHRVIKRRLYVKFPKPSTAEYLAGAAGTLGGPQTALLSHIFTHVAKSFASSSSARRTFKAMRSQVMRQPVVGLSEAQKAIFRQVAQLVIRDLMTPDAWGRHLALTVWNGGTCLIVPDGTMDLSAAPQMKMFLLDLFKEELPSQGVFEMEAAALVARHGALTSAPASQAAALSPFTKGQRWMTAADVPQCKAFTLDPHPAGLILGYEPATGKPVSFTGDESVITIAAPGTGKSQTQIIPNLLRYRGSAIVLDVKGELWDTTAGYRAKTYGPVYRFAPTDASGNTHRYNPFDFISKDPVEAAEQCSIFSYQVIAENPDLKDPYWDNRGRDFFWAFAVYVAATASPDRRTMQGLADVMATPLAKGPDTEIQKLIAAIRELGERHNIGDLVSASNAIATGLTGKDRLESIIDAARRYLSIFNRSPVVGSAMATSDWRPERLRMFPGMTLYICMSPQELKTYAPIVRTMLVQHSNILLKTLAKTDDLPITFFLDEMPQLGNFSSILELQDVGRGAKLRLWMLAQNVGQLEAAFGSSRYAGVIESCAARCFMSPDKKAYDFLQPALGETRNLITGKEEPLATAADLAGPAYANKVVVTSTGNHPMALDKRYAWKDDKAMFLPPPKVR